MGVCVVGSAADNATTSTMTTTMTMTITAQSQQNTSTNSSNSSTTASTAKKEVKGTLTFDVASQQQCNDMAGTAGINGLKSMLSTESGIAVGNVAVTVTCTAKRRLSDGRRLTAYTAAVAYVISVPAGSTITAETAKTSLAAIDNAAWTTKITTAMSTAGITVNVSNMVKTDPTVTTVSDVSFAASIFSVGAAGVFAWMILALR